MLGGVSNLRSNTDIQVKTDKTDRGTPIEKDGQSLGKDTFLQLMIAQIKHQDPFNAQDPSKYIEQMATFTNLEQMINLNEGMELLNMIASGSLINSALANTTSALGKEVELGVLDEEGEIVKYTGTVLSTFIKDGSVYMEVELEDGEIKEFPYESLLKIKSGKEVDKPSEGGGEENNPSDINNETINKLKSIIGGI